MVPSPKLKITCAMGVWSVSVDPLASAVTVNGAGPVVTASTATGGESGPGVGVPVGALVGGVLGLVGILGGGTATGFVGRALGEAFDTA